MDSDLAESPAQTPPRRSIPPSMSGMLGIRKLFAPIFIGTFIALMLLMIVVAVFVIVLHFAAHLDTTDKMAIATSLQVLLGMVVGLACIFWGLLLTWLGIESAFSVDMSGQVSGNQWKAVMQGSAPGIILFIGGVALVGLCLYRPMQFTQTVPDWHTVPVPDRPAGSSEFSPFPSRADLPKLPSSEPSRSATSSSKDK